VAIGAGAASTTSQPPPDPTAEMMNPMIDGQAMLPTNAIAQSVSVSPEHRILAARMKQAGVDTLLNGRGPYTVFAPTDGAFAASGAIGSREPLARVLDYHIVPGRLDSKALLAQIGENGGRATLKTLEGGRLVVTLNGPTNIVLQDETGATANISVYDIYQSNGVIQVIDRVLRSQKSQDDKKISQR